MLHAVVNEKTLGSIKSNLTLCNTDRKFANYTDYRIRCIGYLSIHATIGLTTRKLDLYVVKKQLDTLLGREWIAEFANKINFVKLFSFSLKTYLLITSLSRLSKSRKTTKSVISLL